MNYLKAISTIIFCLLFFGCFTLLTSIPLTIVEDNVSPSYISERYGECEIKSEKVNQMEFDNVMTQARRGILENEDLTDEEKEEKLNQLNKNTFIEDQYIAFYIHSLTPHLDKDLQLSFELFGTNNELIIENISFISYKQIIIYDHGSSTSYYVIWLIKATKPINKDNFGNVLPIYLKVTYPNEESTTYLVKG